MLQSKSFVRKTRGGKIVKVIISLSKTLILNAVPNFHFVNVFGDF